MGRSAPIRLALLVTLALSSSGCLFRAHKVERVVTGAPLKTATQQELVDYGTNRLVADSLEGDWNIKLHALTQAQKDCEKHRQSDHQKLTEEQRSQVLNLASDFPKVRHATTTMDKDRKRTARLLVRLRGR